MRKRPATTSSYHLGSVSDMAHHDDRDDNDDDFGDSGYKQVLQEWLPSIVATRSLRNSSLDQDDHDDRSSVSSEEIETSPASTSTNTASDESPLASRPFPINDFCREVPNDCPGGKPMVQCLLCLTKLTSMGFYAAHIRRFHRLGETEKKFRCPICLKLFFTSRCLESHMQRTHVVRRASEDVVGGLNRCNMCDVQYTHKTHLAWHIRMVHGGSTSRDEASASVSKTVVPRDRKTVPKGNKVRGSETASSKPKSISKKKAIVAFSCRVCGKRFHNRRGMWSHMAAHSGILPFNCSKCGGKFRHRSALNKHLCERWHVRRPTLPDLNKSADNANGVGLGSVGGEREQESLSTMTMNSASSVLVPSLAARRDAPLPEIEMEEVDDELLGEHPSSGAATSTNAEPLTEEEVMNIINMKDEEDEDEPTTLPDNVLREQAGPSHVDVPITETAAATTNAVLLTEEEVMNIINMKDEEDDEDEPTTLPDNVLREWAPGPIAGPSHVDVFNTETADTTTTTTTATAEPSMQLLLHVVKAERGEEDEPTAPDNDVRREQAPEPFAGPSRRRQINVDYISHHPHNWEEPRDLSAEAMKAREEALKVEMDAFRSQIAQLALGSFLSRGRRLASSSSGAGGATTPCRPKKP